MTNRNSNTVLKEAVDKAIRILAGYIEPGQRNCEDTVEQLTEVFDTAEVRAAIEQVKRKRRMPERQIASEAHHAQRPE
jgi:hypothetical protein